MIDRNISDNILKLNGINDFTAFRIFAYLLENDWRSIKDMCDDLNLRYSNILYKIKMMISKSMIDIKSRENGWNTGRPVNLYSVSKNTKMMYLEYLK